MSLTIHPLSPAIAGEIRGLDISKPLDADIVKQLRQAWLDHAVLLFRGQNIDKEQQRAFVSQFGTIGGRAGALPANRPRAVEGTDYNSDTNLVSNITREWQGHRRVARWRTLVPSRHVLRRRAQPGELPLLDRSAEPRRRYDVHQHVRRLRKSAVTVERRHRGAARVAGLRRSARPAARSGLDPHRGCGAPPGSRWFLSHPETGKRALYVNRLMSHRVEGLERGRKRRIARRIIRLQRRSHAALHACLETRRPADVGQSLLDPRAHGFPQGPAAADASTDDFRRARDRRLGDAPQRPEHFRAA